MFGVGLALATGIVLAPSAVERANATGESRTLSFFNIHTKETVTVTFKKDGRFDPDAMKQVNYILRDWRKNESREMDPNLVDLIWTIHQQLGSQEPVHVISGYRSAATNNALRRRRGGQAKKSQHIQGKAADIQFPDVAVKTLRNSALVQEMGGVGYYPTSGVPFVHVDTGRVRMWPRIPRLELAALFPSGRSKYLPKDGKPITPHDYQLAAAKGLTKGTIMLAAATPPRTPFVQPAVQAEAQPPRPLLASLGPTPMLASAASLPRLTAAQASQPETPGPVVTDLPDLGEAEARPMPVAYAPETGMTPSSPQERMRYAFASAAGDLPRSGASMMDGGFPLYQSAEVVGAPEADEDHSDELNYVPFEIGTLMTDDSVAHSRVAADLSPPEQKDLSYIFEDMERPIAASFRPRSGFAGLATAQRFTGEAVRNVYAEIAPPAPTHVAQRF